MHSPAEVLYLTLLLAVFSLQANGASYTITFTGSNYSNVTQAEMGIGLGHAHPDSNFLHWLDYLGVTSVRYFITSVQNWKGFITGKSASWGQSFSGGTQVSSEGTWQEAVDELRKASSNPNAPRIMDWVIETNPGVKWDFFRRTLERQEPEKLGPIQYCAGNPTDNLKTFRAKNYHVLALWHVTCKNLPLSTNSRGAGEYWAERWELYRWFYLGGRFLASNGVSDIELYNEPNDDACLDLEGWLDEVRVRGLALQDAYADHRQWSGESISLNLIVPPMSAPRLDSGNGGLAFGKLAIDDVHTKFPGLEKSATWWNAQEFSYHQYNAPGFGMRSAFDNLARTLKSLPNGKAMKMRISEHNAYASSTAEQAAGKDVMDLAATAAVLAGQVAGIAGRVHYSSVNKFSQTYTSGGSAVVKNGVFWADQGNDFNSRGHCDIGGSTKAAEAYRLMLKRTPGRKKLLAFTINPVLKGVSNFATYTVSDSLGYYIYLTNADAASQALTIAISKLKVAAGAPVVVSGVTNTHHGEVVSIPKIGAGKVLKITVPARSVLMATIPRGTVASKVIAADGDTYVEAGSKSGSPGFGTDQTLIVQTSSSSDQSNTKAALFKFSLGGISRSKIISAVLQITQTSTATSGGPQILTVLGTTDTWSEQSLTWDSAPGLLQQENSVNSVAANFIDYTSGKLVGHVTAGVGSQPTMSLDVGDYLRKGGDPSFLLVRMFRYDQRGSGASTLAGDQLGGPVSLASREAAKGQPVLQVIYQK